MTTADRRFIQFLDPDFGFWLLGSSDRGSQRSPGNLTLSLLCAGCQAVEKMTRISNALKRDGPVMAVMKVASHPRFRSLVKGQMIMNAYLQDFVRICKILFRYRRCLHKYFVNSHPQR